MFLRLLGKVSRALDKNKIPYMVIGGQAVLFYGEPRLTRGIDITLGIGIEGLSRIRIIANRLKLKSLVNNVEEFVRKTMVFPVIDNKSGIRVDFIFSSSKYERQAISRARKIRMGQTQVKIASLEDVIIHKIIAGRPRDLEDVKVMLLKNPYYNARYIEKWLSEFDKSLGEDFRKNFRSLIKSLGLPKKKRN